MNNQSTYRATDTYPHLQGAVRCEKGETQIALLLCRYFASGHPEVSTDDQDLTRNVLATRLRENMYHLPSCMAQENRV